LPSLLTRLSALVRTSRFEAAYVNLKVVALIGLGSSIAGFHFAGPSAYGSFVAAIAICSFGGSGAGGWVGQGLLRYQSLARVSLLRLLARSPRRWGLFVLPVLASGLAGAIPVWIPSGRLPVVVGLTLLITSLFAIQSIQVSRSMVARRAGLAGFGEGARTLAVSGSVAIEPWAVSYGAPSLVGPLTLCCLVLLLSTLILTRRLPSHDLGGTQHAERLVSYGTPLALWIVLGGLYQNLDRVLLERMVSASEAGTYALIYDVANRGLLLPLTALGASLHVRVLGHFDGNDPDTGRTANARIVALQRRVSLAALPMAAAVAAMGVYVFPAFSPSRALTAVLAFTAGLVWADAVSVQREVQGSGKTSSLLKFLTLAVFVNICMTVALIPFFAGVGAATATLVSALLYDWLVNRRVKTISPAGPDR
jgi:O-antigen/teichoic acid export membrane protein